MKLRNKKTGEVHEITEVVPLHDMDMKFVIYSKTEGHNHAYKNLAELNEEWEDVPEEPKEYWRIDCNGTLSHGRDDFDTPFDNACKEIGNYFETREEAEKAVEKLKTWKRLKDNGISFEVKVIDRKWYLEPKAEPQQRTFNESHDLFKDVMLLFGGEE